jgi:hypothetical protein
MGTMLGSVPPAGDGAPAVDVQQVDPLAAVHLVRATLPHLRMVSNIRSMRAVVVGVGVVYSFGLHRIDVRFCG